MWSLQLSSLADVRMAGRRESSQATFAKTSTPAGILTPSPPWSRRTSGIARTWRPSMRGTKQADVDLGRLCQAMRQARLQDAFMRAKMVEMVRERAGAHYSEDAAYKTTPINLMSLYERVVSRTLIAKNPRYFLKTFDARARSTVSAQQDAINEDVVKMRLDVALRRAVISALYGFGAVAVALADPADAALRGWTIQAGMPFVEHIDRDDIVYDIHANDPLQMEYYGWRRRIPTDVAREQNGRK